jgi:hypothetical protein
MAVRGNPKAISLGPGTLYKASIGSTEPTDLATAWDAAFARVGYTEEGSTFSYETAFEDVMVAEELDPLDSSPTGRTATVSFAAAEVTSKNLQNAMNGGTIVAGGPLGATFTTFEPPELGEETLAMLGFESEDGLERWVFRQCKQTGAVAMDRRKGATKTTIANSFRVYKPAGKAPFKAIISDQRVAA